MTRRAWIRPTSIVCFALATLSLDAVSIGVSAQTHDISDASRRLDTYVAKDCSSAESDGDTRALGAAAIYQLAFHDDADAAERLLAKQARGQILDQSSPRYGAIVDPRNPTDPNDTVFGAQPWAPILLRYANRLSPGALRALRQHASAALAYFQKHPVSVSYTNIHLLTSSEEVLLGDVFSDATAQRRGMAGLTQWIAAVRKDGIHEFESPTYFTVDIDALHEGAIFATDAEQRAQFAKALDYLWKEIAANLFVPKARIVGGESRSYDMLYGSDAPMEVKLRYAGFDAEVHDPAGLRCLDTFSVLQDAGSYAVSDGIRALASHAPRVVEQRWADDPAATKYGYVTDAYAIGSSNEDYNQTDRIASIDFAARDRRLVPIRVLADKTGFWYGPTRGTQRDGEARWNHVLTRPATVQFKNWLVVLTDLDGGAPADGGPLTLDLLLPAANDGISVSGKSATIDAATSRRLATGDVVAVKEGSSIAVARIARADASSGGAAPLSLDTTDAAAAVGALRISADEAPTLPSAARDLRSIVLLGVDSGTNAATIAATFANARVTSSDAGTLWNVDVAIGSHRLDVTYDLATHKSVRRSIDGVPVVVSHPFSIDGSPIEP